MASVKVFSFALFLVLLFSVDVEGYVLEGNSKCCNTHPEFGKCDPISDNRRCNQWCLQGCDNKKGGFCKRINGGQCHCYC
ncbi:defensin-like protein 22 [Raphanus sativus]|uniref:Defensin-like protein 22 n=1 Tax=Raphanus sativus TaxID=3726 RepID=A0A6J0MBP0_RAPSA|nr:defensin-like protein 22 [Raphanus sativus]